MTKTNAAASIPRAGMTCALVVNESERELRQGSGKTKAAMRRLARASTRLSDLRWFCNTRTLVLTL
jgi:hypothetical protein